MSDLDNDIRGSLERLSAPLEKSETEDLWNDLMTRRRTRRLRRGMLTALPVLLLAVVALGIVASLNSSDESTDVAAGGDDSMTDAESGSLRVERIQVIGNGPLLGGTERVVIDFNEPLPEEAIAYVTDLALLDPANGIVYTAQGPAQTRTCDSVHGVPDGGVGSVDLFVPAARFADERAHEGPPLETVDNPAKFIICGPHNGYIQYAIWAPLSADPADVSVTVSDDRKSLTIDISTQGDSTLDPSAGQTVVAQFLDDLRAGDLEAASERWTGYPELGPDASAAERVPFIADLMANRIISRILVSDATMTFVTSSTDELGQVVTVLDARDAENPPTAIAFLTGWSAEQGRPGEMWIRRLPLQPGTGEVLDLAPDSFVDPGRELVISGVPVEGGARAFANDSEIPVEVDHSNLTTTVTVPADAEGDIAITIVRSSPELPGVYAFAVTVRG